MVVDADCCLLVAGRDIRYCLFVACQRSASSLEAADRSVPRFNSVNLDSPGFSSGGAGRNGQTFGSRAKLDEKGQF